MNEETYLKIKDALVSESDKINHFTMLGFALFSVLAIRGSSIEKQRDRFLFHKGRANGNSWTGTFRP